MAARKTTKTATTAEQGMEMILSIEPLKTINEAAEYVGVADIRLLELLAETLKKPEAMGWETLPAEHAHLLNEFKATINGTQAIQEGTKSTKEPETIQDITAPLAAPEAAKGKGGKMTGKRKKSIAKQLEEIDIIDLGIDDADALNLVRDAAADGVELGQAQILAKEAARASVRKKAHERTTAKLKGKAIKRADYDPADLLKQAGLQVSDELLADIKEFSEVSLGKLENVFLEVTEDVWANGYNNDFSDLDELLR